MNKNLIQGLVILILIVGIIIGVFLVQSRQILKPKADDQPVASVPTLQMVPPPPAASGSDVATSSPSPIPSPSVPANFPAPPPPAPPGSVPQ